MNIRCTQCGGLVPIESETQFVRCPFCETALYVDAHDTVRHFFLPPQMNVKDIELNIQRKLASFEIKDKVTAGDRELFYFPFWRLATAAGGSVFFPAARSLSEDLSGLKLPSGEVKLFSPDLAAEQDLVEPEILLNDAVEQARVIIDSPTAEFTQVALIHLPFYRVEYQCQERKFTALIEAVSGNVFAEDWPAAPQKDKDKALGIIAIAALVLFTLEAALLPKLWMLVLAFGATAAGVYFAARRTMKRLGW